MSAESLFHDALNCTASALSYRISHRLGQLKPASFQLETRDYDFNLDEFAADGKCSISQHSGLHHQIETSCDPPNRFSESTLNAWFEVRWQGYTLEVVKATWHEFHEHHSCWILAERIELAREFLNAVCEWCREVRGEVLVFSGGCWQKSPQLYQSIRQADLESLVLRGNLKAEIRGDLEQFVSNRDIYTEYAIPWKRGILFVGPPGNGKTHCVKALLNLLGRPCLYVKSFKSQHDTEHNCIAATFRRARQVAPCILVLEDLDSLITAENRSYFLNELDGFAENTGIITLATTNHPEKLDASILERPSRFDMKYHFEFPGEPERLAYMQLWNARLHAEMRLSPASLERLSRLTEGFSFAYLKELFLSSLVRWIQDRLRGAMPTIMESQIELLRRQMTIEPELPSGDVGGVED